MSDSNHQDAIIVGFGLAGALVTWQWVQKSGRTAIVVDANRTMNASRAAAGILNPVTGKRLVKSWNVDAMLPEARKTYREIESALNKQFYYDKTIRRIYQSEEELKRWDKRSNQEHYRSFLGRRFPSGSLPDTIIDPLGSFEILGVGNLDTDCFLDAMQSWAIDKDVLLQESFSYDDLELTETGVKWKEWTADRVIFCEGYRATLNPWFSWLPFNLAKGEILTLSGVDLGTKDILSKQKWILPETNNRFISGSTWSWDSLNETPTTQGNSALLQGLSQMIQPIDRLQIHHHRAGVRPCTRDRFPFIGQHPREKQLYVFNGFGSKGALMIPLLAGEFSNFLVNNEPFTPEADIKRVIPE
jgi:glycine oxidase